MRMRPIVSSPATSPAPYTIDLNAVALARWQPVRHHPSPRAGPGRLSILRNAHIRTTIKGLLT